MINFQNFNLIQLFTISFIGFFCEQSSSLAAVMWSDITATPNEGSIQIQGTGNAGTIPNIQRITPADLQGNTISVDTLLSAVNNEDGNFQQDVSAITLAGLNAAQTILAGVNPTLTLLDAAVALTGSLVKSQPSAGIGAASYNAVANSSDDPIFSISLTFSALAVVDKEERRLGADGLSKAQIQALATFNGMNIPITFTTVTGSQTGNPLEVAGQKDNELTAIAIRGMGSLLVPKTFRGVLSISPVALLAQEDGMAGSADTFSSIVLTNWTATVKTVSTPEPTSTLSLLALGTLGAASAFKRNNKRKSTGKETTKVG